MVAAAYVKDIDASRAFYRLLGFREHSSGKEEVSAWSVMQHEGVSVLLASTGSALDILALPLLFYFFYDDIEAVAGVLEEAGVPVVRTGHPPHALGGDSVWACLPRAGDILMTVPAAFIASNDDRDITMFLVGH